MYSRSDRDPGNVPFVDRRDAGRRLAQALRALDLDGRDTVVYGLPRGGVVVAREVADTLAAPLAVLVVRKLGVPGHEELAFGAVASGGVRVIDERIVASIGLDDETVAAIARRGLAEVERRERLYGGTGWVSPAGRTAVLVDDGLATGSTMRAAIHAVRAAAPRAVVVAVPVAPPDTVRALEREADRVVALLTPEPFYAVGVWYQDFRQVDDDTVRALLAEASARARTVGVELDDAVRGADEEGGCGGGADGAASGGAGGVTAASGYRFVEHTGEVALEITAPTLERVFELAVAALAELLAGDASAASGAELPSITREVEVRARDLPALLAEWMAELLYLADSTGFVPCTVERLEIEGTRLWARVRGRFDTPSALVKAVTYHQLELARTDAGWRARVVLDV